jgi:hypothetical protein
MMLEILNRVMPLEVPHVQRNNEKLVRHYMAHSKDFPMNQQELAAEVGVDDGYLSSIISPSKDTGRYRRTLTGRDVLRFTSKGVYKVKNLGLNVNDPFEEELLRLAQIIEKDSLLQTLFKCFEQDIDPEDYLRPVLSALEKKKSQEPDITRPEKSSNSDKLE